MLGVKLGLSHRAKNTDWECWRRTYWRKITGPIRKKVGRMAEITIRGASRLALPVERQNQGNCVRQGHAARMGENRNANTISMENLKQEGRLECTSVDGRILNKSYIKRILRCGLDLSGSEYREMASSCENCSKHSTLIIFEKKNLWLAKKILVSQESLCGMEWGSHLRKKCLHYKQELVTDVEEN